MTKKFAQMDIAELDKKLTELNATLRSFRFGITGRSKNVKLAATTKKEIAHILTELNSRKQNA